MAITQKKIKERIADIESLLEESREERKETLESIKKYRNESNVIDIKKDENIIELVDSLDGIVRTITQYTGALNELEWVLSEMRTKNKKRDGEAK